jgi:hypothetical protein
MQADRSTTKQTQKYKSVSHAFMTILRTEGLSDGLYKVRKKEKKKGKNGKRKKKKRKKEKEKN